jgi:hypothetical protein
LIIPTPCCFWILADRFEPSRLGRDVLTESTQTLHAGDADEESDDEHRRAGHIPNITKQGRSRNDGLQNGCKREEAQKDQGWWGNNPGNATGIARVRNCAV